MFFRHSGFGVQTFRALTALTLNLLCTASLVLATDCPPSANTSTATGVLPACANNNDSCGCSSPSTTPSTKSQVAKNLRYRHYAFDYVVPKSPTGAGSSCATGCGGNFPTVPGLPALNLERIHHPDTYLPSSLGSTTSFNHDVWLQVYPPGTEAGGRPTNVPGWQVLVAKPMEAPIDFFVAVDATETGTFQDGKSGYFKSLQFFLANGTLTPDPSVAASAVLTEWTGETWLFEMFTEAPGTLFGRPVKFADRNGNGITHTWKYAITDATLTGSLRTKLHIRDNLIDAYGRTAHFTYNEMAQVSGQWVTTRIDLPNGQHLAYDYNPQPTPFGNNAGTLSQVTHPDGMVSTFNTVVDAPNNVLVWTVSDPVAEPQSRYKQVWLSNGIWVDPMDPTMQVSQIFGRVRRIIDGNGDEALLTTMIAFPLATGGTELRTYSVTQGKAMAVVHDGGDRPTAIYERNPIDDGHPLFYSTADWSGWTKIYSLTPGPAALTATAYTDANGHTVQRTIDPATDSVLGVQYPDGSSTTTDRNGFQQITRDIDRSGRITLHTYDAAGNHLSEVRGSGTADQGTWQWTYWTLADTDANRGRPGQVRTSSDARGNVTNYFYYPSGDLYQVVEPADTTTSTRAITTYTVDVAGRCTSVTDPANRVTQFGYDGLNRQVSTLFADTSTEVRTYPTSGANAGLLSVVQDRNAHLTTFLHDGSGRVVTTTRAAGTPDAVSDFMTFLPGNQTLVTTQIVAGDTVTMAYDRRLRKVSETRFTAGNAALTTQFQYDDTNRMVAQIDPFGRRTAMIYDVNDRMVRSVRELVADGIPTGSDLTTLPRILTANPPYVIDDTAFDASGLVTDQFDGRGNRTQHQYDAQARRRVTTEAVGTPDAATITVTYDPQGNVIARKNARLFTTTATFSGRNLQLSQTEAFGTPVAATTTYTYTPTKKVATVTDALFRTTSNTYGVCCDRLVAVTDPLGFITAMAYDFYGNRTSLTDANNLATLTTYDARNRPVTITNAAGETTTLAYLDSAATLPEAAGLGLGTGADGSAVITTNPRLERSVAILDGVGRTVRNVDGLGHATTMAYDLPVTDAGTALVAMTTTDPLTHTTTAYQDGAGRTRVSLDALNKRSTMGFDSAGNRVTWRDANAVGLDCVFDARNRDMRCTETAGAVTIKAYDANNNLVATTDALLKVESSVFDPRDRKTSTTDRVPATTTFTYDAVSNLLSITDAEGGITLYQYESRNLLNREVFPNGQTRRTARYYGYDPGRRLTSRTVVGVSIASAPPATPPTPNEVTTYGYDNANRLTTRGYADSLNDTFGYDTASRLTSANSARYANQVARLYDAAGRLAKETLSLTAPAEAADLPVSYQYDNDNRVTQLTYPDGSQVQRAYTDRNELQQVWDAGTTQASRFYDDAGRLTSTLYGNGLTETRSYTANDNTTASISIPGVTNFAYQYDANKRKTAEQDNQVSDQSQRFGYDDQNRVTTWKRSTGIAPADPASEAATWNLSQVGDWTTFNNTQGATTTQNRLHDKVHELVSINGTALTYDVKGNLTKDDQGQTFTWDFENRLLTAVNLAQGQGNSATYGYDALGRRVKQSVKTNAPLKTEPTYYVNAGAQEVVAITGDVTAFNDPTADSEDAGIAPYNSATGQGARGSLLEDPAATRYNFQPADSDTPDGWLADSGAIQAAPTSVGWTAAVIPKDRNHLGRPLYDTFAPVGTSTWKVPVANGTHSVVIMCGDADSRAQTNHLKVNGVAINDPTPYDGLVTLGYETGSFDGYALTVNVTTGFITIQSGTGALRAKLNFIEVAPAGTTTDAAALARVQAAALKATHDTGKPKAKTPPMVKRNMWGTYVDELVSYTVVKPRHAPVRYYTHSNHLYSIAATTNTSGAVVERYSYNAYGVRTVKNSVGATIAKSSIGQNRGFTSYKLDSETGLYFARNRLYSQRLGVFLSRDDYYHSIGWKFSKVFNGTNKAFGNIGLVFINSLPAPSFYIDGMSLYEFMPGSRQGVDPSGEPLGVDDAIVIGSVIVGLIATYYSTGCEPGDSKDGEFLISCSIQCPCPCPRNMSRTCPKSGNRLIQQHIVCQRNWVGRASWYPHGAPSEKKPCDATCQ